MIYGFPESHPERDRNDELLRDVFVSLGAWKCPILVAGDMNSTITQSSILSQSERWGFFRVSPDKATTVSKDGMPKHGLPIDHMLANLPMIDRLSGCQVDWGVALSDHYPLIATCVLQRSNFRVAKWPSPPKICQFQKTQQVDFPDLDSQCTFEQWQKATRRWLQNVLGVKVPRKDKVREVAYRPPKMHVDQQFRRLLGVERAVAYILEHGEADDRRKAVERKLKAILRHHQLESKSSDWEALLKEIRQWTLDYTNRLHKEAIAGWRREAITWTLSTKAAYAYLRNPVPSKTTMFIIEGKVTCEPKEVELVLNEYWQDKEMWPKGFDALNAVANLEEYYSFFLPHVPFDHTFELKHLVAAVKLAKNSAPGLDAWTVKELKILPETALSSLFAILTQRFHLVEASITATVKRVPLEKVVGANCPDQFRPIDLFSTLLRVFSSAVFSVVRPWALEVLHKDQCASRGGTFVGCSRVALMTELAQGGYKDIYAVTVDFAKMFNMLSWEVAAEACRVMGLCPTLIELLVKPLRAASYTWKLPFGAVSECMHQQRGLPQGMASSVLLAEIAISPLLRKIELAMKGRDLDIIAYVDDLNFITTTEGDLLRIVQLIGEYSRHFALDLAREKTKVWATKPESARRIAAQCGLAATQILSALGADWPTSKDVDPTYAKENERIAQAERRITRLRFLPVSLATKMELASVACLSLLDYVNSPLLDGIRPLRLHLKTSLGHQFAAPEILYHVVSSTTLDPVLRWLVAGLKLWHAIMNMDKPVMDIELVLGGRNTRMTRIAALAEKWEIRVVALGFWVSKVWVQQGSPGMW